MATRKPIRISQERIRALLVEAENAEGLRRLVDAQRDGVTRLEMERDMAQRETRKVELEREKARHLLGATTRRLAAVEALLDIYHERYVADREPLLLHGYSGEALFAAQHSGGPSALAQRLTDGVFAGDGGEQLEQVADIPSPHASQAGKLVIRVDSERRR